MNTTKNGSKKNKNEGEEKWVKEVEVEGKVTT